MAQWSEGYVSDIGYTYGYYSDLNPAQMAVPFLSSRLAWPQVTQACELGFGQGVSINAHAAGGMVRWSGTDFNPNQASFAQELANVSGSGAGLFDQSFAEFCTRTDLPDFDFIGLHGIWSWISNENRALIVDFIRRKLKLGGVLYISYNVLPGWSATAPLRHILSQHDAVMGAPGQAIPQRIDASLAFARQLLELSTGYRDMVPSAMQQLDQIAGHNRNYLAHEYFNRDWTPMYFSEMAQWLAPAKLSFACSSDTLQNFDAFCLNTEQQALLANVADPVFRQTARDYLLNRRFRKDYWVKGARPLSAAETVRLWRQLDVQLVRQRQDIPLTLNAPLGTLDLKAEFYNPVLDLLADLQPHNVAEIEQATASVLSAANLHEVLSILHGTGALVLAQSNAVQQHAAPHSNRLNHYLTAKAMTDGDIPYLISPVTGGCVNVGRIHQMFLQGLRNEIQAVDGLAAFAWQGMQQQDQRLIHEGKALETAEENLKELGRQAQDFLDRSLPHYRSLGLL